MMDIDSKITSICDMQKTIISCLKAEIDNGVMNIDTEEAGKVVDIVKDLAQAEKYIREASYYTKVVEAMEEPQEDRYGYTPRVSGNIRYGYKPMVDQEPYVKRYLDDRRSGYNEYGTPYNEYVNARRHYTETGSSSDKTKMDMHAREHLDQTIETLSDIWDDATPELKAKMKSDLKALMDNIM